MFLFAQPVFRKRDAGLQGAVSKLHLCGRFPVWLSWLDVIIRWVVEGLSLSFLLGGIKIWEWIIRTRTELRERSQMWRKRLFEYFRRSKTLIGETCFLPMKAVDRNRKVGLTYIPLLKELVFQTSLVYSLRHLTLFCHHPNHVGTRVSLMKRTIKSFLGFTLSESLLAIRLQHLWVPLGLGRGKLFWTLRSLYFIWGKIILVTSS